MYGNDKTLILIQYLFMCGVKETLLNRDYFKKILSLLKQKGSMILTKQVKESVEECSKVLYQN